MTITQLEDALDIAWTNICEREEGYNKEEQRRRTEFNLMMRPSYIKMERLECCIDAVSRGEEPLYAYLTIE